MKKIKWRHIGVFIFIVLAAFVADRILKEYLLYAIDGRIEVLDNVFALTITQNTGVAFSIKLPYLVQILITPLILILGIKFAFDYLDMSNKKVIAIIGFITGGALGNFVDRVLYGGVIDYLSFWRYPIFNLADVFIVVGIFIIVAFYGKIKRV